MIETFIGHFKITFENGYTVSVFNGFGSYTENHLNMEIYNEEQSAIQSNYCEVAIIYGNKFVNPLNWEDKIRGWVTPAELADIFKKVSRLK